MAYSFFFGITDFFYMIKSVQHQKFAIFRDSLNQNGLYKIMIIRIENIVIF